MKKAIGCWLRRPWSGVALVTLPCVLLLIARLIAWDIEARCPGWFFYGLLFDFSLGLLAAGAVVVALIAQRGILRVLPMLIVVVSAVAWVAVPWENHYMRLVWTLHEQEYADTMKGLREGRLVVNRESWIVPRAPGPRSDAARPLGLKDIPDVGPLPNVYFQVHGGHLFDWRSFGFLYTEAGEEAIRCYWGGMEPTWTPLKPHWYLVRD